MTCPWGEKALTGYLGSDQAAWLAYDSCELVKRQAPPRRPFLVDQGEADGFLEEQLRPELAGGRLRSERDRA